MSLKLPVLDDRTFKDLMREATAVLDRLCPDWIDRSPSDPGITLLELFAFLTEVLIYRVNQLPEKAHFALLDLLGVAPRAPSAAEVTLTFSYGSGGAERDLPATRIPAGTIVSDRDGTLAFVTLKEVGLAGIAAGSKEPAPTGDTIAIHAERIEAELIGRGSGEPGLSLGVRRGPVLRRPNDPFGLVVAIETSDKAPPDGIDLRSVEGRTFAIWKEVQAFAGFGTDDPVYIFDRARGMIVFGPASSGNERGRSMGAVPAKGREIRAWYWRGGGRQGNAAAGKLITLKTPIRDVSVENREAASGGEDMEPIERAIARGREAVRTLRSAVTARDFENVACETPGIARARAYAPRDIWVFGRAGVVEVLVVPRIEAAGLADGIITTVLAERQTANLLANARDIVRARRPIGVETRIAWARCRPVDISARVMLAPSEDKEGVKARLARRLHALLAPDQTWPFGRPLRASDAYEAFLSEPGVRYVERLNFHISDAPSQAIARLHRDRSQPTTFYAAGLSLFRSLDSGDSWASILERSGEVFLGLRTSAELPGYLAAFSRQDAGGHVVYISLDGGESFDDPSRSDAPDPEVRLMRFAFPDEIRDVAWSARDGTPALYVAGKGLLKRIRLTSPITVDVVPVRGAADADRAEDQRGFEAVAVARHVSGLEFAAVATRERLGVYLAAGDGPFKLLPDTLNKNIRVLAFQKQGNDTFLWAGLAAEKGEPGKGALRIGLRVDGGYDPTSWEVLDANWANGSCEALDFWGDIAAAGSNRGGVLLWRPGKDKQWSAPPPINCGLPLIDERRSLAPAKGVAIGPGAKGPAILFGCDAGVYRSDDLGRQYRNNGRTDFEDRVPLPRNWLFCSGTIDLEIAAEDGSET